MKTINILEQMENKTATMDDKDKAAFYLVSVSRILDALMTEDISDEVSKLIELPIGATGCDEKEVVERARKNSMELQDKIKKIQSLNLSVDRTSKWTQINAIAAWVTAIAAWFTIFINYTN